MAKKYFWLFSNGEVKSGDDIGYLHSTEKEAIQEAVENLSEGELITIYSADIEVANNYTLELTATKEAK